MHGTDLRCKECLQQYINRLIITAGMESEGTSSWKDSGGGIIELGLLRKPSKLNWKWVHGNPSKEKTNTIYSGPRTFQIDRRLEQVRFLLV